MSSLITSMQKAASYKNALKKDLNKLAKSDLYFAPLTKLTGVDNAKLFYQNIAILMNGYEQELNKKASNVNIISNIFEALDATAKAKVQEIDN